MDISLFISIMILIILLAILAYIVYCYYFDTYLLYYTVKNDYQQDLLFKSIKNIENNISTLKCDNMISPQNKIKTKKTILKEISYINDIVNDIILHMKDKTQQDIDQWTLIKNICLDIQKRCNLMFKEERFSLAQIQRDWSKIGNDSNNMIKGIGDKINWLKNALSNVNWGDVSKRLKDEAEAAAKAAKDAADEAAKRTKDAADEAAKKAKDIAKKADPRNWGCFSRNTKVTLSDGSVKRIIDVVKGDYLLGWGGTFNRAISVETFEVDSCTFLWGFNKMSPFFSDGHVFMTNHGWKSISPKQTEFEVPGFKVGKLQVGDIIFKIDTSSQKNELCSYIPIRINSLERKKIGKDNILYNIDIEGNHSYHANSFVVHSMFKTEDSDKIEEKKIKSLDLNEKKRLKKFIIKEFSTLSKIYGSIGIYQLAKALGISRTSLDI